MYQTRKDNRYYFGMKAHIGVDDESGSVHSLVGTATNVANVTLLHGVENVVCADTRYTGVACIKDAKLSGRSQLDMAFTKNTVKTLFV